MAQCPAYSATPETLPAVAQESLLILFGPSHYASTTTLIVALIDALHLQYYAPALSRWWVKVPVLIFFILWGVGSLYGIR